MAPRYPASNQSQKPGRPKINLDPWLEKMHDHVLAGETDRRASDLVAQVYRDEIPQGTTHGQRIDESTARLLRKYYPHWLKRQAELDEMQANMARMSAMFTGWRGSPLSLAEIDHTPEARATIEAALRIVDSIGKDRPMFASKWADLLDATGWARSFSRPGSATVIKSQKSGD